MASIYLHQHPQFADLLTIVAEAKGILPTLVEKDYWIIHVLHGLKKHGLKFELKGGTSLSKGYGIIHRFSEDIDIHIHPPAELGVEVNPKKTKEQHVLSRKGFMIGWPLTFGLMELKKPSGTPHLTTRMPIEVAEFAFSMIHLQNQSQA